MEATGLVDPKSAHFDIGEVGEIDEVDEVDEVDEGNDCNAGSNPASFNASVWPIFQNDRVNELNELNACFIRK